VPDKYIHEPWRSPDPIDYTDPIVDHDTERKRSLAAYDALRGITGQSHAP
jgi:deoxyribodipyrimidine photolyase